MGSPLLGLWRLATYLAWTGVMLPVQMLAVRFGWPARKRIPRFYHRVCTRLLGFDVVQRGRPASAGPVLFVSNHSSYLDITVLGSVIEGSFIAKTEVRSWPFFGLLARLQQSVFVDRRLVTVDAQRAALQERLAAGDNLILFPEGTSSDGNRTLPFKSALFAVAAIQTGSGQPLTVQPLSITCTALDGIPLGRLWRDVYAWYGETGLLQHLWRMIRLGRLTVVVAFHEPTTLAAAGTRKALAEHCWQAVAGGVAAANAGRLALAV